MKHSLGYFDYETGETTVTYRDNNKFTLDENECKPVPPAKVCIYLFMYVSNNFKFPFLFLLCLKKYFQRVY